MRKIKLLFGLSVLLASPAFSSPGNLGKIFPGETLGALIEKLAPVTEAHMARSRAHAAEEAHAALPPQLLSTFRCVQQQHPRPAPGPEQLFRYALHLDKGNLVESNPAASQQVLRLYRIAAAHGHVPANLNLQSWLFHSDGGLPEMEEVQALNQRLLEQNLAPGYYNLAYYVHPQKRGTLIQKKFRLDREQALLNFRKAADLGSPEAQFHIAKLLAPFAQEAAIAHQMYRCAAEQGHPLAARALGISLKNAKEYNAAAQVLQLGVKAGDPGSAYMLENSFNPMPNKMVYSIELAADPERSRRYQIIRQFLSSQPSYLRPTVEEIDQIVPLPPAPLPPWDGSLQWQKAFSGPGPDQPSEELISQLAKAKQLDPATGLSEPAPQAETPPGTEPTEPPRF